MIYGTVTPGSIFRHFKGGLYEIVDFAKHTETGEVMVVYRSMNEPEKTWVRPADMFFSKVDRKKYPNVRQEMRFEFVMRGEHR